MAAIAQHLLFVPRARGYALEERDGEPPELGEEVTMREGDGRYVVSKLGPSPLPGDARPCAYLQHATRP